jgi:hypothetical protein
MIHPNDYANAWWGLGPLDMAARVNAMQAQGLRGQGDMAVAPGFAMNGPVPLPQTGWMGQPLPPFSAFSGGLSELIRALQNPYLFSFPGAR